MKRQNKYCYLFVIQGFYFGVWEDLCQSESFREARTDLKAYRLNEGGVYRMIQRSELNA